MATRVVPNGDTNWGAELRELIVRKNDLTDDTTGRVPPAQLGSGTPSASVYLRGDGAWTAAPGGTAYSDGDARAAMPLIMPGDHGYITWSVDPAVASSSSTPTAGVLHLAQVRIAAAGTVTGIGLQVATAGTGLSDCYVALLDSAGARLGVSTDQSTAWGTGGYKLATFTAAPVTAGTYYVGILMGAGSNLALSRAASSNVATAGQAAPALRSATSGTGLTAIPASVTMAGITANPTAWFVGLAGTGGGGGGAGGGAGVVSVNGRTGAVTGLAEAAHNHSGSDITTGTVPLARLPTGTTSTTVALGNHTHTGLGGYDAVQDDGSARTARTVLNFVGDGVSVTDDPTNSRTIVTIPGGGGGGGGSATLTANLQTGTAYTLVIGDAENRVIERSNAAANTVTIPPHSSVAFPIGTLIEVCQVGAGQTTIVGGSGVTLRPGGTIATRAQWSTVGLRKRAENEWLISGDTG